jgi:hypothetical protein
LGYGVDGEYTVVVECPCVSYLLFIDRMCVNVDEGCVAIFFKSKKNSVRVIDGEGIELSEPPLKLMRF